MRLLARLRTSRLDQLQLLEGNIGLLFTDEEPEIVTDWFASFKKADFARSGNPATETITLPEGLSFLSLALFLLA